MASRAVIPRRPPGVRRSGRFAKWGSRPTPLTRPVNSVRLVRAANVDGDPSLLIDIPAGSAPEPPCEPRAMKAAAGILP